MNITFTMLLMQICFAWMFVDRTIIDQSHIYFDFLIDLEECLGQSNTLGIYLIGAHN
jgi:hypothetical protein